MAIIYKQTDSAQGCNTGALCSAYPYYIPNANVTYQAQVGGTYGITGHSFSWSSAKPSQKALLTLYLNQDPTLVKQIGGQTLVVKHHVMPGVINGSKIHSLWACKASTVGAPGCTSANPGDQLGSVVLNQVITAGVHTWTIPNVAAIASPVSTDRLAIVFVGATNPSNWCGWTFQLDDDCTHNGWSLGGGGPVHAGQVFQGAVFGAKVVA